MNNVDGNVFSVAPKSEERKREKKGNKIQIQKNDVCVLWLWWHQYSHIHSNVFGLEMLGPSFARCYRHADDVSIDRLHKMKSNVNALLTAYTNVSAESPCRDRCACTMYMACVMLMAYDIILVHVRCSAGGFLCMFFGVPSLYLFNKIE